MMLALNTTLEAGQVCAAHWESTVQFKALLVCGKDAT